MLTDLRTALRALLRAPGLFLAAAVCLGLALGANAAAIAVLDAIVLRPLPFAEPERLVDVRLAKPSTGWDGNAVSVPYALDLRDRSRTLAGLAAYTGGTVAVAGAEGAERVKAGEVSRGFFDVLGVRPLLGRAFLPNEHRPGAPGVVVLAEPFWRTHFGADPRVVGRTLALDGRPATVVGVMPAQVGLTGDHERLWQPMPEDRDPAGRGDYAVWVVARLAPGATLAQARGELASLGRQFAAAYPATDRGWEPHVRLLNQALRPGSQMETLLWVMLGATGFVLLIAAANVANLMLARTAARARELAVRAALGAGWARLARLVVAESVLIAGAGLVLGAALGGVGIAALRRAVADVDYPAWVSIDVDARVLVAMAVLALAAGVGAGLAPAVAGVGGRGTGSRSERAGPMAAVLGGLRAGGRTATAGGRRLRDGLVVGELALSLALLAGAALMVKSAWRLAHVDPGFAPAGLVRAEFELAGERYDGRPARLAFARTAAAELASLPSVRAVAAAEVSPLTGWWSTNGVKLEGRPVPAGQEPSTHYRGVGAGYFATLGITLVEGREFTPAEAADSAAGVAVVNETLARRFWPGASALGRRVSPAGKAPRWLTVVGVARDVRQVGLTESQSLQLYQPLAAHLRRRVTLFARAAGAGDAEQGGAEQGGAAEARAASLLAAARPRLRAVDRGVPLVALEPMSATVRAATWSERLFGALFSVFAAAALLLAAVGVYGVVAYQAARRARELGVRVALGARPADVLRLVLGDGARLAALGTALGLALAAAVTRALAASLYGVSPTDPAVLAGVAAVLGAAALLASWAPARRAARADPVEALRAE